MNRLAFALLLALVPFGADADTLFVSPKGSDRGNCNSCQEIIRAWIKTGLLYSKQYKDPKDYKKDRAGLYVDSTKRPS